MLNLALLFVLLIAPGLALRRLATVIEPALLFSAAGVVSLVTYIVYAVDKRRAEAGAWRIPESTLHVLELIGGWPGAFIAQRRLRHKIRKVRFQAAFWLIVAAHQFVAIDHVRDWSMSRAVYGFVNEAAPPVGP